MRVQNTMQYVSYGLLNIKRVKIQDGGQFCSKSISFAGVNILLYFIDNWFMSRDSAWLKCHFMSYKIYRLRICNINRKILG